MAQQFILAAQSVTGAVITIVALLLVAAVIGYVSAWFYSKSIYTPIVKGLQKDKEDLTTQVEHLNRQVEVMKSEIIRLNGTVEKRDERIQALEKEVEEKNKEIKKISTKPVKEN